MRYLIACLFLIGSVTFGQTEEQIKLDRITGDRSIGGSTFLVAGVVDNGGGSYTISFVGTNASADAEWIYETSIIFPVGWVVTDVAEIDLGGSWDTTVIAYAGNAVTITDDDVDCAYGYWDSGSLQMQYDVTVTPVGSPYGAAVAWQLEGDAYGLEPHVVRSASHPATVACVDATGIAAAPDVLIEAAGGAVPTMSQWGLLAFITLLMGAGVFMIRKR